MKAVSNRDFEVSTKRPHNYKRSKNHDTKSSEMDKP